MPTQLASPAISVNDEVIGIVPNSVKFKEGKGTQTVKAQSSGGGNTEQVYSQSVEDAFGSISFDLYATVESVELARVWKSRRNFNHVTLTGKTPEGSLTRNFAQAALLDDYEVDLGSDATFSIMFSSEPAV